MRAVKVIVGIILAGSALVVGGCGSPALKEQPADVIDPTAPVATWPLRAPALKDPPSDVLACIERETKKLSESGRTYYAGLELGRIGLVYRLPPATLESLRTASGNPTPAYENADYDFIGGGRIWLEAGDGAKIAFLMWRLRDLDSDAKRIQLLWSTFCETARGTSPLHQTDAIGDYCIRELIAFKREEIIPYLFTATPLGNWSQRRLAALHLGDYWPVSEHLLLALTKSQRKDVAEIARRNLRRKGKPLPPSYPAIGTFGSHSFPFRYGIPSWPDELFPDK